jgi:hypothetical protein
LNLLAKDVIPVVARDGIEPPTPAFSGLHDQSLTGNPQRNKRTYAFLIWTPFGRQTRFGLHMDSTTGDDFTGLLELKLLSRAVH